MQLLEALDPRFVYFKDRATAIAAGVQLKPQDPSKPIKRWKTKTKATAPISFTVADANAKLQAVSMSANDADDLNLPGATEYQKYEDWLAQQPASGATTVFDYGGGPFPSITVAVKKDLLLTPDQANTIAALIGGTVQEDPDGEGGTRIAYAPGEQRRMYNIFFKDWANPVTAGKLFAERNRAGMDAPGHFNVNKTGATWVADPQPMMPAVAVESPIPIVVPDGYELRQSNNLMGSGVVTIEPISTNPVAVAGGGGFTDSDRNNLIHAMQTADAILKVMSERS